MLDLFLCGSGWRCAVVAAAAAEVEQFLAGCYTQAVSLRSDWRLHLSKSGNYALEKVSIVGPCNGKYLLNACLSHESLGRMYVRSRHNQGEYEC